MGSWELLLTWLLFTPREKIFPTFPGAEMPRKGTVIHSAYEQGRKDGALTSLPPNPRTGRPGSVCLPHSGIQAPGPNSSGGALGSQLLQPSRLMILALAFLQRT